MKQLLSLSPRLWGLLLLLVVAISVQAQPKGDRQGPSYKTYLADKKNFLMKQMMLSPEDSIAFFSLYDVMQVKKMNLQKDMRNGITKYLESKDGMSDAQCEDVSNHIIQNMDAEHALQQEYYAKFKAMLTPCQFLKFQLGEMRFNHVMLQRRNGPPPGKKTHN